MVIISNEQLKSDSEGSSINEKSFLDTSPNEVLLEILRRLSPKDLSSVSVVNTHINKLYNDLLVTRFGSAPLITEGEKITKPILDLLDDDKAKALRVNKKGNNKHPFNVLLNNILSDQIRPGYHAINAAQLILNSGEEGKQIKLEDLRDIGLINSETFNKINTEEIREKLKNSNDLQSFFAEAFQRFLRKSQILM